MAAPLFARRARLLFLSLMLGVPGLAQQSLVDYRSEVHPLLAENCVACHNSEKRSGGLSLATYEDILEGGRSGPAVKPGKATDSLFLHRVTGEIEPRMPMGRVLPEADVALLQNWIDEGARPSPDAAPAASVWEPMLSLDAPAVPGVVWEGWEVPADRFTAAYLAERDIARPETVPDALFARRVYLDVWGLLPPPEELRAFLSDEEPDKRERLVARLLADEEKYAEHWISYWNDLLRNDEGANYYSSSARRKSITDWLLDSLASNAAYDRMVRELLNPTEQGDPDGFLTGVNWRGAVSAGQTPAIQAAQNTAQIFLGVNLKCNSCHDSFINQWKLKDAYGLAAYFSDERELQR